MRKNLLFIFLLFSIVVCGQEAPQVTIIQPINNAVFEGKQVRVSFEVSGAAPNITRIYVDDRQVQLLTTEIKIGQNTTNVDVPGRDCKISIVAENSFGQSRVAVVNLKWNEQIFKPALYILAIGVSQYNDRALQLQFAAKDASDFTQSMLRQEGLVYEKVDVKQLADETATAENIRDGLYWLQSQTTFKDVAMIYMAGHGINNNVGEFFFMPVNADINRINATCVRYAEIKATVDNVSGKLFMFVDACHSGNVLGNNQRRAAQISQAISEMSSADNEAIVFTSSSGQQFSLENPDWNNGAFTKALVEGLDGKADLSRNGTITVLNLASYVADRVKELTGGQQTPVAKGNITNYPIALVKKTSAEITLVAPQEGAIIMIDNERKGIATWTGALPEGNHIIEIQKESYRPRTQNITVTGGKNQTILLPELVAMFGMLNIQTTNAVAEIFIDGIKQNRPTPAFMDHLSVGEHTITLTAGGYDDFTKTVTIEDGKTADMTVALVAEPVITIVSNTHQENVFPADETPAGLPAEEKKDDTPVTPPDENEYEAPANVPTEVREIIKPVRVYMSVTAGAGSFGSYTLGEINNGGTVLFGADVAYFFSPYIGAGLKFNVASCKVNFKGETPFTYRDQLTFFGPALFGRLGKERTAFTIGAGIGIITWELLDIMEDHLSVYNEAYTAAGGFLSAGFNYMFTPHFGFILNVQTVAGTIKDQYDWERKPAGIGGTLGLNFRF